MIARVRALLASCHPLPCLAVTGFLTAYAAVIGLPAGRLGLLAGAVLAGQLSIGWSNDAIDAGRDATAGRTDKPVARDQVGRRAVTIAAGVALLACVPLSLALGPLPGTLHLIGVAAGWAYNLWLKFTPASPVPYLVAFGLLPAVATQGSPGSAGRPPVGVLAGAALLGLAAHFANTVGDAQADAETGVRGLPQRIGPQRSLLVTAVAVATAGAVLLLGAPERGPLGVAVLATGVLVAATGAVLGARSGRGPRAFRVTLVAVGLVVAGFLLSS